MADPFSIAASAFQVASFAATIITGIGRFVAELRSVPASIRELGDSIEALRTALQAIQQTFDKRPRQLPFERDHHVNIGRILTSCHETLDALEKELPRLDVETTAMRRVVLALEKAIKEPRVQELRSRITSYTNVLQISLNTVSIGALWGTQRSQAHTQAEIRKLSDRIRAAGLFSKHSRSETILSGMLAVRSSPLPLQPDTEDDPVHIDETKSVDQEIQDWARTVDDVASAVLSEDLNAKYYDRSIAPQSSISVDRLPEYEPDNYDPEPHHINVTSREILEFQLAANREYVDMFRNCGLYVKASAYQRRGIEIQDRLAQSHNPPSSSDNLADMKEVLVEILLECETEEGRTEAKSILQALLDQEIARPESERDLHRKFRLYHAIGELYFSQNMTAKAKLFLERAFEGRKEMEDCPLDLVKESAEVLARLLHGMQEYDSSHGIREWVRCHLDVPPSPAPSSSVPSEERKPSLQPPPHLYALNWCRSRGMDVDSPTFGFDLPCHFGMTPVQIAIEAEDREALRDMLEHVSNVDEHRDPETHSTPLHMAASKRNNHLVRALLEKGAAPSACDRHGSLPLHRCQSSSGGVKVAQLLLEDCLEVINAKESLGKTALYLACELGNEKMVRLLLKQGADPDVPGPGLCTPLVMAIELASQGRAKMGIIEALIKYHANPTLEDNFGRNAFSVATHAGLASYEIKKLLGKATPELRPRAFSTATTSTMTTIATITSSSSGSSKRTDRTGSSRYRQS